MAITRFAHALVRRLASFDRETLAAAKAQINRFGMPTAAELQSSNDLFFPLLALPSAQARRAKIRGIGYGVPSDFELNSAGTSLRSGGRTMMTRVCIPTDRRPESADARGFGRPDPGESTAQRRWQ